MSLNLSLDITTATLADLEAFLAAARAAGATGSDALELEDAQLRVSVTKPRPEENIHASADEPATTQATQPQAPRHSQQPRSAWERTLGDNALRSVIDILSERLDPPRGGSSFGNFGPSI